MGGHPGGLNGNWTLQVPKETSIRKVGAVPYQDVFGFRDIRLT